MDEQLRKLVASVRAYHDGQFAKSIGAVLDPERRRLVIAKNYDELVVSFTADEAQALLQALREMDAEARIGEWAREIALERAQDAEPDEQRQRQAEERVRDAQGSSQAK